MGPMRKRITKFAATVGLALGLVVIGGSVIGGIALAMDHGQPPAAPAPASDATVDGHDVATATDDNDSADQDSDSQDGDEQRSDQPSGTGSGDDQLSDHVDDDGTNDEPDDD